MEENNNPTWDKINKWREELEILHAIIVKTQLIETTKWGAPVYTYNGENVIGLGGFKSYFTIWFFQGVFLKDEAKVLINAQTEVTKALRQWRFTSKEEINEKLILRYLEEAIKNVELGKKIKASPKKKIIDTLFQSVLESDATLNIFFSKFTPAKQNEFMEYIDSAKKETTKWNRIEKIKPLILAQKGLNDAYRK